MATDNVVEMEMKGPSSQEKKLRALQRLQSQKAKDLVNTNNIKAGIFFVCLLLFIWQAALIIAEYCEKEIATKGQDRVSEQHHCSCLQYYGF